MNRISFAMNLDECDSAMKIADNQTPAAFTNPLSRPLASPHERKTEQPNERTGDNEQGQLVRPRIF
jgi:hypothetical protein